MFDGIEWVSKTAGWHTFHCLADDMRPIMALFVNENDPDCAIWIGDIRMAHMIGETWNFAQITKGRTHLHVDHDITDEGVTRHVRVCPGPIVQYIVPRSATMMARVYVPADTVQIQPTVSPDPL